MLFGVHASEGSSAFVHGRSRTPDVLGDDQALIIRVNKINISRSSAEPPAHSCDAACCIHRFASMLASEPLWREG